MSSSKQDLIYFKKNITSSNGEDGVIKEIFNRIGTTNKLCIEFGAWDGKHLSNTWHLWHECQWSAILIEGDKKRHKSLAKSVKHLPNVTAIQTYVQPKGKQSLDTIEANKDINKNVDLLSIDIDGDDYYIFEGLNDYLPRCLIVEFNPTIPPEIDYVQPLGAYMGCSASALVRLAASKGYELVTCTDMNCIFILQEEFPKLGINKVELRDVFSFQYITYVISSFDGSTFLNNNPNYAGYIKKRLRRFFFRAKVLLTRDQKKLTQVSIRR